MRRPGDQLAGHFQLGLKSHFAEEGQKLGVDILAAHVEASQEWQTDGAPQWMPHHPRQCDPHMAIDKLGAGRSRRRIVVHAGPFHLGPVALARRVVDRQHDAAARHDHIHGNAQHHPRKQLDLVAKGRNEVIIILVVLAKPAGAQPTGNGAASGSEHQTGHQRQQPPGQARVQKAGKPIDPDRDVARQTWGRHPWLSGAMQVVVYPLSSSESLLLPSPVCPRPLETI